MHMAPAEAQAEVAQEAPVQTAVYMSRVQRAKMANAARAKAAAKQQHQGSWRVIRHSDLPFKINWHGIL